MRTTPSDLRAALRVQAQWIDAFRQGKLTDDEFRRGRGRMGERTAALGKRVPSRFPAEVIPSVVTALLEYYGRERRSDECFGEFVQRVGVARLSDVARTAA